MYFSPKGVLHFFSLDNSHDCKVPAVFHHGAWMLRMNPKTIFYECHNGYKLEGAETQVCLSNGSWSPAEIPSCVEDRDADEVTKFGKKMF